MRAAQKWRGGEKSTRLFSPLGSSVASLPTQTRRSTLVSCPSPLKLASPIWTRPSPLASPLTARLFPLPSRRLLLGEAVKRSQSPHEIDGVNADHAPIREE